MSKNSFEEVIDFAISREKEAVQFYQSLQNIAKFNAQKVLLQEFENMEKGHVTLLENVLKRGGIEGLNPKAPVDLHLNEYLVPSKPAEEMTYQDILITAIKREEKSANLYSRMLDDAEDEQIRKVFSQLVTEESKHKNHFEQLYEQDIQTDN